MDSQDGHKPSNEFGDGFEEYSDDNDLDDTSFAIALQEGGDEGSGYRQRIRNDPNDVYQRVTVAENTGSLHMSCKSREVVHGFLSLDSDEFATLLVYELRLDAVKRGRRVKYAKIEFEFKSSIPNGRDPEVHDYAPSGRVNLLSSTHEESVTKGSEISLGAPEMLVSAGGSVKWEKTISRSATDEARVIGDPKCNKYGKQVGVSWTLHENESIKSGVPSMLRCAILLVRKDDEPFKCVAKVYAEPDWKSQVGSFWGRTSNDDPIYFDPSLPPTNRLRKDGYDTDNLEGTIKLNDLVDIRFGTVFKSNES